MEENPKHNGPICQVLIGGTVMVAMHKCKAAEAKAVMNGKSSWERQRDGKSNALRSAPGKVSARAIWRFPADRRSGVSLLSNQTETRCICGETRSDDSAAVAGVAVGLVRRL